jgi:hypothetical protein
MLDSCVRRRNLIATAGAMGVTGGPMSTEASTQTLAPPPPVAKRQGLER